MDSNVLEEDVQEKREVCLLQQRMIQNTSGLGNFGVFEQKRTKETHTSEYLQREKELQRI